MKKKSVSQANSLMVRNESDWFTGKLRRGGGGGGLLGSLVRSNVCKFFVCSSPVLKPRGGLDIFTYRDQQSVLGVLNFENLYFFGTGQSCCIFWGLSYKCCIFKTVSYVFDSIFLGPVLFTRSFSKHSSSLLSSHT